MKQYLMGGLLISAILSANVTAAVEAVNQPSMPWPMLQSLANFNSKNDAAPIHYRQLHKLYPTRTLQPGQSVAIPVAPQQVSLQNQPYEYLGVTSTIEDYLQRKRVTGMMLLKDGSIRHQSHFFGNAIDDHRILFSTTKSIVSLLVGIAVDDGFIKSVDDPITAYLPELKNSGFAGATVKQVLQMTTAIYYPGEDPSASGMGRDIRGVTAKSLAFGAGGLRQHPQHARAKPGVQHGEVWEYLNTNTQTLTVLLERVTGQTVSAYAEEKLWRKLGAEKPAYWLIDRYEDAGAIEHGWMGLIITLRDMARIGLMVANHGHWNGQQIVSESWLEASTTADNPAVQSLAGHKSTQYGYQWWMPVGDEGEFMSIGHAGQIIYVNPTHNVVIVQTAADPAWGSTTKEEAVAVFRAMLALAP